MLLLLCPSQIGWSQVNPKTLEKKFTDWVTGYVVLVTGDTIHCEMTYSPAVSEGMLQVKDEFTTLALTVKDVKTFYYVDSKNRPHRFYALSVLDESTSMKREHFLEYIYGNPYVAILSRRTLELKSRNRQQPSGNQGYRVSQTDVNYLLNVISGQLSEFNEKEALALMIKKADEVNAYIKTNHIRLKKDLDDYIQVFDYFAKLQ